MGIRSLVIRKPVAKRLLTQQWRRNRLTEQISIRQDTYYGRFLGQAAGEGWMAGGKHLNVASHGMHRSQLWYICEY